jgi:SP family facilitated glucose transporter-like MFS transporter 1
MDRYEEKIEESKLVLIFSLAVNAFVIGGMIGGLSGGWLANKVGRKNGLLYSQALSLTGAILSGCSKPAEAYEMIIVGRLLIGIACGLFTGLVPLYITEVAPLSIRGGIGIFNQLAVTSGIFMGQILGLNGVMGSADYWPILVSFTAFPSALQTILLFALPESPRYVFSKRISQNNYFTNPILLFFKFLDI